VSDTDRLDAGAASLTRRAFLLALGAGGVGGNGCRKPDRSPVPLAQPTTILDPRVAAGSPLVTTFPVRFTDVSGPAGLTWRFTNGASPRHPFVEQTGGGVALFDYNRDGLPDIFAVQGGPVPGQEHRQPLANARNVLYRNNGNGTFTDVTAAAGLAVPTGYGQGVAVADYDNDGWPDLYVTAYGGNHLFHNNGDGTFTDVTAQAGISDATLPEMPDEPSWATSAAWGDYDNDGFLDLYICHYCRWTPARDRLRPASQPSAPMRYPPSHNRLYHNNGDGTFTDVTQKAGLGQLWGKSLAAAWIDYDDDGWLDLFVTNDTMPNFLLHNNRDGTFTDLAGAAGVALDARGHATASMGIGVCDFRREGRPDLFVVNYSGEPKTVRHNVGQGLFEDAAQQTRIAATNLHYLGFGLECFDYDLDGWPDLIVGNGHVSPTVPLVSGDGETYAQSQQLLHNQGDGTFVEDLRSLGDLVLPRVTRGLAVGDYDNDGDVDVVMVSQMGALQLFRNDGGNANHWITFRLEGVHSNRDAVGAKVVVHTRGGTQTQWVRGGSSYCSHSDMRLTFGLGRERAIQALEVRWPRGMHQRFGPLPAGRFYWLREASAPRPDPWVR
jgi:enediyne biosynthesis protein E4